MAKAKKAKAGKAKKSKAKKAKKKPAKRAAAAASRGARKSKAKKSKAKAPKKAKRKAAKRPAAAKAKKSPAKKAAPKKKKQITGEGDYQASRSFLKDQGNFVKRHNSEIPQMGKDAEAALDGPQGGELRAAEAEARSHSKTGPEA